MNNYEKLNLYEHNIESYKKIKETFEAGETTVSIVHATGTGKTYNALALALDHKEEKIIWVVPSNAIKEHIEKIILDNKNLSKEIDFPNLEIVTYQSFINMTKEEIKKIPCDLLILDEIQHLGAPIWGERIETFVEFHENIKKFGMTAYTVRDRGTSYERDVTNPYTDEIFSDSVVSRYDLCDALIDGVLPKPIYKTVITEDNESIIQIRDQIEKLKRKGDTSYIEYQKMLDDIIRMIHKQNGVKELIQQTVKPDGKYIYFCPINTAEGKNDIDSIMLEMKNYLKEKFPDKKIIFYKTTSKDEEQGKYNRECFYNDIDLEGNDVSDSIRIIFAKNQYNQGVHAPNVDGVFMGRRTRSDIVAFEQIGRALSVRGNTKEKTELYNKYTVEELKHLAISRGLPIEETDTKQIIIEKLLSPIIIDLADNIGFIEELETNLKDRIKESRNKGPDGIRPIKISDPSFNTEVINKELLDVLKKIKETLNNKSWDDWYNLAKAYYDHYGNSEIPSIFKTNNGYEYDENGKTLGDWINKQRRNQKNLSPERRQKLEEIDFRYEIKNKEEAWNKMYNLAKAYYNYHGNTKIPNKFKTINGYEYDENGKNLGDWTVTQRRNQDKLSLERRQKLEQIEFRIEYKKHKFKWNDWYNLAKAYYDYRGNSEIPNKFKTINGYKYDENGENLGEWINNQRQNQENLSSERREKLEQLNFRFKIKNKEEAWNKSYTLAKAYYDYHGNSEIPTRFKTINGYEYDENGNNLGEWIITQRRNQKNLSPERKQKLEEIDFRFEIKNKEEEWNKSYTLAKAYYDYHGNSEIPSRFKTINGYEYDENGNNLGNWIVIQRGNEENLSPERRQKLELIGLRFKGRKEHQTKMIDLCTEYGLNYKKNKFLIKIPYQELYAKINFLLENNYKISENGELNPIFLMSNINMQSQYGISKEELIIKYYINRKGRGV